jgi:hypothetical protein
MSCGSRLQLDAESKHSFCEGVDTTTTTKKKVQSLKEVKHRGQSLSEPFAACMNTYPPIDFLMGGLIKYAV